MLEQRITTQNQQNWLAKLLGYEFDVVYKLGAANKVANALSRREEERELQVITRLYWQNIKEIDEEVQKDPTLAKIIADLKQDSGTHTHFTLEHERLYYKGRLVIAASSA